MFTQANAHSAPAPRSVPPRIKNGERYRRQRATVDYLKVRSPEMACDLASRFYARRTGCRIEPESWTAVYHGSRTKAAFIVTYGDVALYVCRHTKRVSYYKTPKGSKSARTPAFGDQSVALDEQIVLEQRLLEEWDNWKPRVDRLSVIEFLSYTPWEFVKIALAE